MGRYRTENGIDIPFTPAEEASFDAMKIAYDLAQPMNDWKADMQRTDSGMPRYLEDLITDKFDGNAGSNLQTRYDEKVALRATKP